MSNALNLDAIDADGAIRETASEAMESLNADTRSQFLRRAGIAGGAVMGGGALLGALAPSAMAFSDGDRPPAKFGKGDFGILNYALTLEYLEASFYNGATAAQRRTAFLRSPQARILLKTVTDDENKHVAVLKKVLGKHAVKKPKFNFHGDNAGQAKFLTAAFTFENDGVHAYSGQAFNIKDPKVLAAAFSIVTIEARHASVVGPIKAGTEKGISLSGALDTPFGASKVLKDAPA